MAGFEQKWKEYKRLRNTFLIILLSGVPIFALCAVLSEKLFHTTAPASVIAMVWFAAFFSTVSTSNSGDAHVAESGFLELGGTTKVFLPDDACIAVCRNTKNSDGQQERSVKKALKLNRYMRTLMTWGLWFSVPESVESLHQQSSVSGMAHVRAVAQERDCADGQGNSRDHDPYGAGAQQKAQLEARCYWQSAADPEKNGQVER